MSTPQVDTPLFKRNTERHSEDFGDTLQLFDSRVPLTTAETIQILFRPAYLSGQFCFAYVFFNIAFFKSILVSFFIMLECLTNYFVLIL